MHCVMIRVAVGTVIASGLLATTASAQTPPEELDDNWINVCGDPDAPGYVPPRGALLQRCNEILDAGPGSGDRRSDAALGNNLGTVGAQGRMSGESAEPDMAFDAGRFSLFVTTSGGRSNRDASIYESGFEADHRRVFVGIDYLVSHRSVAGITFDVAEAITDFDDLAGDLESRSASIMTFASHSLTDNLMFNTYFGHGWQNYDATRNISYGLVLRAGEPDEQVVNIFGVARGETGGNQMIGGLEVSVDMGLGSNTFSPFVKVDFSDTKINAYRETDSVGLAVAYEEQVLRSFPASVGLHMSTAFSTSWGVLSPQVSAAYVHEFEDDGRAVTSSFVNDPKRYPIIVRTEEPDRDFGRVNGSLAAIFQSGLTVFADVDVLVGHRFLGDVRAAVGLRTEF